MNWGLNVALHIQPFHWKRQGNLKKSILLNPNNVPLSIENFGQNIHDLHSAVLYLKSLGHDRIGTIGASLGGFTSAQYAVKFSLLDFYVFVVVPAIDFWNFLVPHSKSFSFKVDDEVISASKKALEIVSPLHLTPDYDVEKIGVVMHGGDRLCEHTITRSGLINGALKTSRKLSAVTGCILIRMREVVNGTDGLRNLIILARRLNQFKIFIGAAPVGRVGAGPLI